MKSSVGDDDECGKVRALKIASLLVIILQMIKFMLRGHAS